MKTEIENDVFIFVQEINYFLCYGQLCLAVVYVCHMSGLADSDELR